MCSSCVSSCMMTGYTACTDTPWGIHDSHDFGVVLFKTQSKLQKGTLCLQMSLLLPSKHGDLMQEARASRRTPGQVGLCTQHVGHVLLRSGSASDVLKLTALSNTSVKGQIYGWRQGAEVRATSVFGGLAICRS